MTQIEYFYVIWKIFISFIMVKSTENSIENLLYAGYFDQNNAKCISMENASWEKNFKHSYDSNANELKTNKSYK